MTRVRWLWSYQRFNGSIIHNNRSLISKQLKLISLAWAILAHFKLEASTRSKQLMHVCRTENLHARLCKDNDKNDTNYICYQITQQDFSVKTHSSPIGCEVVVLMSEADRLPWRCAPLWHFKRMARGKMKQSIGNGRSSSDQNQQSVIGRSKRSCLLKEDELGRWISIGKWQADLLSEIWKDGLWISWQSCLPVASSPCCKPFTEFKSPTEPLKQLWKNQKCTSVTISVKPLRNETRTPLTETSITAGRPWKKELAQLKRNASTSYNGKRPTCSFFPQHWCCIVVVVWRVVKY